MSFYIGNADNKAQYVAGFYYGNEDNKPVRVVAGWIGDDDNKPRLFYSPSLQYTVDAYGADWWGGVFNISMLNVRGGTGRYYYKLTLTVEGQAPMEYAPTDPVRDTSCSHTFTLPGTGTYATWEATVIDAANSHCIGTETGRFDIVPVPISLACTATTVAYYQNGKWVATIHSNVLKNYDVNKVAATIKEIEDDFTPENWGITCYEEYYANPEVWFTAEKPGTYVLQSFTLTTARGISATVSAPESISMYLKSKTVPNVIYFYGYGPQLYFDMDENRPSMEFPDAVYGARKVNDKWYAFTNTLVYQNGDLWDGSYIGTLYFLASDWSGEIAPSATVYYA